MSASHHSGDQPLVEAADTSNSSESRREPLLRLEQISKSFGDHVVLNCVDLDVAGGEVVALIGPSGAGKSTLLRCVNLLETPTAGRIVLQGTAVGATRKGIWVPPPATELTRLRRRVGMVFQSFNLFPHLTALQNVVLGQVHTLARSKGESEERARDLLDRVGLLNKADSRPAQLSGGQQQRIAIARALALDPVLMLFDEPTSAIDPELGAEVLRVMRQVADSGMTMMIVTHEMHFAEDVADRVAFIADGGIMEQGPPSEILRHPQHQRTQQFLAAVLDR